LGGSLGLALTTIIAQAEQSKATSGGAGEVQAISKGLSAAFYLGAAFAVTACLLALVMLRDLGIVSRPQPPSAEETKKGHEFEDKRDGSSPSRSGITISGVVEDKESKS
jgi:hypothetical protein